MKWIEPPDFEIPAQLLKNVGGHSLVSRILTRRGLSNLSSALAFINPDHYQPCPPGELPGLMDAAEVIEHALREKKRVCVWGDFDVDGQTSTALLVSAMRRLGSDITFHIPNRERESHGISLPALKHELKKGFDILLTCDTGISAHTAIEYARRSGVAVVITDHHDLPESLPNANAVTNPKMLPDSHPLATLPGVGVAYKLAEELYSRFKPKDSPDEMLDLVALGIVADVALLQGDVRYLLQRGIKTLRATSRLGLLKMMKFINLSPQSLTEEQIGFALAPRLNALGRLSDTNIIVDFLTTNDPVLAQQVTVQLEQLNSQRKLLTDEVLQGALSQVERDPSLLRYACLVLVHPSWHGGVLGPAASRLVEIFHKPCILLCSPPGEDAHGSARSVDGCDISAALRANQHFLHGYGGHPMAAGLSLSPEDIPAFRVSLSHTIHETTGVDEVEPTLELDAYLNLSDLSMSLLQDIEHLAPFGPGNPQPLFCARNLELSSERKVGRDEEHLILTVEDDIGNHFKIMRWRGASMELPQGRFDLAYHARPSDYQGRPEMSIIWVDARQVETPVSVIDRHPLIEVFDHRRETHQLAVLHEIIKSENIQVWCEGEKAKEIGGTDRTRLEPASVLVIWTTPPSRMELDSVLQHVKPDSVHLFSVDPPSQDLQSFLRLLLGMVKHTISSKGGETHLENLAAFTAQRLETIRLGLYCLEKEGLIRMELMDNGSIQFFRGNDNLDNDKEQALSQLRSQLEETSAYRRFFYTAALESLHHHFKPTNP